MWGETVGDHAQDPAIQGTFRQLIAQVEESHFERNLIHVRVECGKSGCDDADRVWEKIDRRFTVLASVPDPESIASGSFEDHFDVLAASNFPSPIVAKELAGIEVEKELVPMSTVRAETDDGVEVVARSWTVHVCDPEPRSDEPATFDFESVREGTERLSYEELLADPSYREFVDHVQADGWRDAELDEIWFPDDDAPTGADSDGTAPADESDDDEPPVPAAPADGGDPATAPDRPAPEDSRTVSTGAALDELLEALEAADDTEDRRSILRDALPSDDEGSEVGLEQLESRLRTIEAHASAFEALLDPDGSPAEAVESVDRQIERLREELDRVLSQQEAYDQRLRSLEDSVAELERVHTDHRSETSDRLDAHEDRIEAIEAAGPRPGVEPERVAEIEDRLDDLEAAQGERIESLEEAVRERQDAVRDTLAAWITHVELELFEIEEELRSTEEWRRSVSEALRPDARDE